MVWYKSYFYYLLSVVFILSTFLFGINKAYAQYFTIDSSCNLVFTSHDPNKNDIPLYGSSNLYYVSMISLPITGTIVDSPILMGVYALNDQTEFPLDPSGTLNGANGTTNYLVLMDYLLHSYYIRGSYFKIDETHCSNISYDVSIPTSINSFTYSTTTQTARVQGYWNATSTSGVTERLQFNQFSNMLGTESFKEVIATSTGSFDYTFDYKVLPTPATGTTTPAFTATTTLFAKIYQYNENYASDPFSGVFDSRYKTLLVATTTTITATTSDLSLNTGRDVFAYPEYECGITSLTGCIKNALIWAFYPTEDSINQYKDFISLLQSKAPIGYFYQAKDSLTGLSATSTDNIFDITIPYSLKRYIFTPFDVAIAGILWFFFLINFYKRFKTIQL